MRQPHHIRAGDPIRVRYLQSLEQAIEDTQNGLALIGGQLAEQRENANAGVNNLAPDQLFEPAAERAASVDTEPAARTFTEVSRDATTVRIENPEDSEQYVDVSRADSIVLVAEDGEKVVLVFDNS